MKLKLTISLLVTFISLITLYDSFAQITNPNYNEDLAKELGADDYGMKSYILVMLKTGSNTQTDPGKRDKAFAGHMSNMKTLATAGELVLAGPLGSNENQYRGIFILNVQTKEAAEKILQSDPAINAKYLAADLYEWYGSAALIKHMEASDKVWKSRF